MHVDLTEDNEVIDVEDGPDEGSSEQAQPTTNGGIHDTSPAQPREPVLFDTSLEGLNEAHHAILEEERNMERDMTTITDEMKEDILKLLVLTGIPWIEVGTSVVSDLPFAADVDLPTSCALFCSHHLKPRHSVALWKILGWLMVL